MKRGPNAPSFSQCLAKPQSCIIVAVAAALALAVVYVIDMDNSKRVYIQDTAPNLFAFVQGLNVVLFLIFAYNAYYVAWNWLICVYASLQRR